MSSETKEPSLWGILLSAISMLWLGVLFGVIAFLSIQPKPFSSLAERDKAIESKTTPYLQPSDSHYFSGPVLRGTGWTQKREALVGGSAGEIELSAGEVNAWLDANFRPQSGAAEDAGGSVAIVPQAPNVALVEEGLLHLSLPATFDGFGMEGDFVMHAVGRFTGSDGGSPQFEILRFSINAAPMPALVGQQVFSSLLEAYRKSEELKAIEASWENVASAEVAGGVLRLQMR